MLGYPKSGFIEVAGLSLTGGQIVSSLQAIVYGRMIDALIAARKGANVTQSELGQRIGQRHTFVSKFELGERRLDAAEFVIVSRAIGADPYSLLKSAESE